MWPIIINFARAYVPYIIWPVSAVIGFVGYNFESIIGRKQTPWKMKSIQEERDERILKETKDCDISDVPSLKSKTDIPKTVLDRNDKSKLLHNS